MKRRPISIDNDLLEAVKIYNGFVEEWNRREADWDCELPSASDDWSPVNTSSWHNLHPGKHVYFEVKATGKRYIVRFRRGRKWAPGLSFMLNPIDPNDIVAAYEVY
jgi:hypothetical protein